MDKTKDSLTRDSGFKSRWHKQADLMQSTKSQIESKVNTMACLEKDLDRISELHRNCVVQIRSTFR